MSELTEFRNTALKDQVKKLLASGNSAQSEEHSVEEKPAEPALQRTAPKTTTADGKESGIAKALHSPFAFATFKKQPPSVQKNADRSKMLGQLLDDAPEWVSEQALGLCSLWKEISASDEGSATRVLFEEQAGSVIKKLVSFLEGKEVDGNLSDDEKARLARSSSLYYASVIWSAKEGEGVPDGEIWRALWFLLKTGAARITHSFPQGVEHIQALPGTWIEFPHAFLDAPTTDGRALEKSELIEVSGAVIKLIKRDSSGFWYCQKAAQKSATIHSLQEFYEAPCAGTFVVQALPLYRKEAEQFLGGGLLVVKVAGREDAGFHVSIIEVIDDCLLATFDRSSRMKDVALRAKFASLSSGFNAVLRGERLSSLNLPLEVFGKKELNEKEMNPAPNPKENDDDKFRALSHIARVLKRAIRMALPPALSPESQGKQPGTSHAQERGGRTETAKKPAAAENKTREPKKRGEAVEDLKSALIRASEKNRLPIREMAEFFSSRRPHGVALASIPSSLYVEKGKEPFKDVACVLLRRKDGDKAEVYAFPPHLADLFCGKYNGLIFAKIAGYAKWLFKEKREEKQASGEEGTRVPEQSAVTEDTPQAGGNEVAEPLPVQAETASESSEFPVEKTVREMAEFLSRKPPHEVLPQTPQETEHPDDEPPKKEDAVKWASPQARALAEEHGSIDILELAALAQGKKVTKADVEKLVNGQK